MGMDEEPDFEAITVVDPDSDFVYIANEEPAAILEFDVITGQITRVFDIESIVHQHNYEAKKAKKYKNKGIEALAFVPSNVRFPTPPSIHLFISLLLKEAIFLLVFKTLGTC